MSVLFLSVPITATAQFISPGKLAGAHTQFEGIQNCTNCHELGQRSADNTLCLDCHTPLQNRIQADLGFHSTVKNENCASCHKEHFGVDFLLVRLDTLTFNHKDTGFELRGSHQETSCRSCHQPDNIFASDVRFFKGQNGALEKTFLGLEASCLGCHVEETPHQNQFPDQECNTCHVEEKWVDALAFDHDDANFQLIGKHQEVSCEGCHPTVQSPAGPEYIQYTQLDFNTCQSCHDDVHEGSFGTDCASCHSPKDWNALSKDLSKTNFDHETTGFSLVGAHAQANCVSCHNKPARRDREISVTFIGSTDRNSYPRLASENCLSCHVDYHNREFLDAPGGGAICENCHGQHDWFPTTYDIARHNKESAFELTGAHMATPCTGCHAQDNNALTFNIEETTCQDCHIEDNPHGEQFADANQQTVCSSCHVTESWLAASNEFDHDQTDFPLTGKHIEATCASCHTDQTLSSGDVVQVFSELDATCESCHQEDDPHQNQFPGTTCSTCHTTESFIVSAFNHDATRFPLTGAHLQVECQSCHLEESSPNLTLFTRFRPLPRKCEDCHGEE